MHGAYERGSRPIANDNDKFYEILLNETAFYGWPDFFGNGEPVTDPKYQSERNNKPLQFLMQDHPPLIKPLALFQPAHTSAIQTDLQMNPLDLQVTHLLVKWEILRQELDLFRYLNKL